jgi:tetratricopeptide (TPR) repeat protein
VDNRTGKHVWADSGALDLERWDQIQFVIVRNISSRLGIYVSVERLASGFDGEDGSLAAYDQWLQGEHLLESWAPEAEQQAERLFLGVIEELPRFAPVYSSLASIYNVQHLINVGSLRDLEQEERAMKLAQTAVDLDPLDTRAHLTLAWSYCMAGQYGRAELHYDLACELAPNNPRTLVSAAQGLAFVNAIGKAVQLADQAIDIAPFLTGPQWAYIAAVRFLAGDYAGCVEASKSASAIVDVAAWEAAALTQLGRRDEAVAAARRLIDDARGRWIGAGKPDEVEIIAWLLNCYPVRPGPAADRFRDGLTAALGLLH